jgi:5-methylcytosine-specific restriction endonuclease McrA
MRFHRTCENCKVAFYDYPSNRIRFCSQACSSKFRVGSCAAHYKGGGSFTCRTCLKQVSTTPGQVGIKRYWSRTCYAISKKGKLTHSMEFYRELGRKHAGPLNHNWKGAREHQREVARLWQRNHMESVRIRNAQRRARQRAAPGTLSLQEWQDIKVRYRFSCLACRRQEPEITLTVDHIVPLIKGGSHYASNIQPLCKRCNSGKREKAIDYRPLMQEAA